MSTSALLEPSATPALAVQPTIPTRHRWSVSEFQRMGETGFFDPESRLELIEGELFEMAPIGTFHASIVDILNRQFGRALEDSALVRIQNPIVLGDHTEPQPDLTLLRVRSYFEEHPHAEDVLLLVEVSDSTVQYDREIKLPLYARHAIPEVWLVIVPQRCIEVYRIPQPEYGDYQTRLHAREGVLAPVLLPRVEIRLDELFIY